MAVKKLDLDVVVCAKNRATQLERVLKQIIHEIPFKDLIVIYGSSKDKTREVAERYATKVFWDGDKGLGAARNLGIRKAGSELVAMIDTDVLLTKDWYKHLVRHFENDKVAAVMGSQIYGYGCQPIQRIFEYWRERNQVDWSCSNTIFRRNSVLEVGNFDKDIHGAGEDYDLYKRLLIAGYKWIWDREVVVYHPMNFFEALNHKVSWAIGVPYMREFMVQLKTCSLFRIYCRSAFLFLLTLRESVRLAFSVDPSMLFFLPMSETMIATSRLKALKKMLKVQVYS